MFPIRLQRIADSFSGLSFGPTLIHGREINAKNLEQEHPQPSPWCYYWLALYCNITVNMATKLFGGAERTLATSLITFSPYSIKSSPILLRRKALYGTYSPMNRITTRLDPIDSHPPRTTCPSLSVCLYVYMSPVP